MGKIKAIFCVLFGHAKVVTMCFGYVYCARCGDQIGDTLGGVFDLSTIVVKGHEFDGKPCLACEVAFEALHFRERFLTGGRST